jgi:hypothetical protein
LKFRNLQLRGASDERRRFEFTAYHRAKASRDGIVERHDDYLRRRTNFARPASWISSRICGRFFIAPELVSSPSELAAGSSSKTLDYIFNRLPIAAIRGGIAACR